MISQIKLKIHLLGNKALFLSLLHLLSGFGRRTSLWPVGSLYEITKKPKCLGHMKLPNSSRAPYQSKTREPVGNSTACRVRARKIFRIGSHVRALRSPAWVLTAPYGSAFQTTVSVHDSCGPLTGSERCLEIFTGPARAVTFDYGRFAYMFSQARKTSTRARTVPTRAQYGTRRVDVRNLTIRKKNRLHIERPYICDHAHRRRMISYGLPKGHSPVRLPKSYGPGPLVVITRCCGHMHTGVLWFICVFRTFSFAGTVRSRADVVRTWESVRSVV